MFAVWDRLMHFVDVRGLARQGRRTPRAHSSHIPRATPPKQPCWEKFKALLGRRLDGQKGTSQNEESGEIRRRRGDGVMLDDVFSLPVMLDAFLLAAIVLLPLKVHTPEYKPKHRR